MGGVLQKISTGCRDIRKAHAVQVWELKSRVFPCQRWKLQAGKLSASRKAGYLAAKYLCTS